MVNEDANAKLIRELKEEIQKLRELLKAEGIEVHEGNCFIPPFVPIEYSIVKKETTNFGNGQVYTFLNIIHTFKIIFV